MTMVPFGHISLKASSWVMIWNIRFLLALISRVCWLISPLYMVYAGDLIMYCVEHPNRDKKSRVPGQIKIRRLGIW